MPLAPKRRGAFGIARRVGVREDLESGDLVGPAEQGLQFLEELGLDGRDPARIDLARAAVYRDHVAFGERHRADLGFLRPHVDVDRIAARYAGFAHAARDDGRV